MQLGVHPHPWHCMPIYFGTRPWSQCWSSLIRSRSSRVTTVAAAICTRSLWLNSKLIWTCSSSSASNWVRCSVRRAVFATEYNFIQRKEILCKGENLLFSLLTWRPNWLRWLSTRSLCSHSWSRECASRRATHQNPAFYCYYCAPSVKIFSSN